MTSIERAVQIVPVRFDFSTEGGGRPVPNALRDAITAAIDDAVAEAVTVERERAARMLDARAKAVRDGTEAAAKLLPLDATRLRMQARIRAVDFEDLAAAIRRG